MVYGRAFEKCQEGNIHNSFETLGLGNGFFVSVPNLVQVSGDAARSLYVFGLDPTPNTGMVRIIAQAIDLSGNVAAEPTAALLLNRGFVPTDEYHLKVREYPDVLVRTFGIPGIGRGRVSHLITEQYMGMNQGWLCRVGKNPDILRPSRSRHGSNLTTASH